MEREHPQHTRGRRSSRAIVAVGAAICCVALVSAGDIDPPPGPVGDSGPSLATILNAVGGGGGMPVVLRSFATPPDGSFETVASEDGVLQRAVLTNLASTSLVVHVRDANGLLVQLVQSAGATTTSQELGIAYTAPLEAAVVGSTTLASASFVLSTD